MNIRPSCLAVAALTGFFCAFAPTQTAAAPAPAPAIAASGEEAQIVFDGGLKGGWQDWGWAHRSIESGKPARLQLNKYAGWILGRRGLTGRFKSLQFNLKVPPSFGDFLEIHLAGEADDSLPRIALTADKMHPLEDGWVQVDVPFTELNPSHLPFDRIKLRAAKSVSDDWVMIDKLVLLPGSAAEEAHAAAQARSQAPRRKITLRIDCRAPTQPISPYIYGTAFVPRHAGGDNFQWEMAPTIRRWGGNPASRYNWKLGNAWNTASDWFYQNVNYTHDPDYSWKDFLAENKSHHVSAAVTIPMLGWVAKDTDAHSFPVSTFGPQQYSQQDAGNGVRKGGGKITGNDPKDTSLASTPEFVGAWVEAMEKSGGVAQYILDNEPALWNSTHRDVHPKALTYDELLDKTIAYATQVRKAAPKALIAGPAEWGWPGYFFSAKDAEVGFSAKPDRRAHGDVPLLNYYLRTLSAHEKKTGVRLLDVVDLHYYPQTKGLYGGGERTDATSAATRIRATRSLWDPTYKDESWINENIQLLPRLKSIIAQEYPGLKISLGEYNFGGEKHISGGLALAEALGRFGQAGVYSAYYWTYPPASSPAYYAFRAFRNYDGHGSQFQDQSLATTMAQDSSLFASRDASNQKLTAIALNLNAQEVLEADIELVQCGDYKTAKAYTYEGGADGLHPSEVAPKLDKRSLSQSLSPYSITVFELAR